MIPGQWAGAGLVLEQPQEGHLVLLTAPSRELYCTVLYCTVLYCNAPRPPHRSITGTVPVLIAHSDTDVVPI